VVQLVARAIMLPDFYQRPPHALCGRQGHRARNKVAETAV
jgi:hypothetical protein